MKTRFGWILLLCLIMVALALPVMAEDSVMSGNCGANGDNVTWTYDESSGVLTISGVGEMENYTNGEDAPWYDYHLLMEKVIVEDGVTSIGDFAFFSNTTLDEDLTDRTYKKFTSVELADSVTSIGSCALYNCLPLTTLTIPKNVESIGSNALQGCSNLTKVYFEGNVPQYDASDFNVDAVFYGAQDTLTIYYYDGTTGWSSISSKNFTLEKLTNLLPQTGYTANLSVSPTTTTVNQQVEIIVEANKTFAASDLSLTYDPAYLTFNEEQTKLKDIVQDDGKGTLRIVDFGTSKTSYTLVFNTRSTGTASVTLNSAAFSTAENAATEDLTAATIENSTITVTVSMPDQIVTLPSIFIGNATVAYGTHYTFSLASDSEYFEYSDITATIGDNAADVIANGDDTYTVENITAALVITATRTPKSYSVSMDGNGAGDANNWLASATYGETYTLNITEDQNYTYMVTATVNDQSVPVNGGNGTYTVEGKNIIGNIVFTVTKTSKFTIAISEFLTLGNSTTLWLITVQTEQTSDLVCKYNEVDMYWSEKYNAYCTVLASTDKPTINAENLTLVSGTATAVHYGGDVNNSSKVDVNDAQFVYNMYTAVYSGITETVTAEKYLRADINGDKKVDTEDAAAIVYQILHPNGANS